MKAISVRQPWAELIIRGKKKVEIRKLKTNYRGDLLIHAGSIRGNLEFVKANIDPKLKSEYKDRVMIGIVNLIDIIKITENLWGLLRNKHLIPGAWLPEDHIYAWILEQPKRITPIHYVGLPAIFRVNEQVIQKIRQENNL